MSKRMPVIVILVVLAGAAGAWWYTRNHEQDGALTLYGNVDIREVDLAFRVSGRLATMKVDEGDHVEPGALLAQLDDEPYREALAAAQARVAIAVANLEKFRSGSRPQEVQRAEANVREAEAALTNAERELTRQRELADQGLTSASRLDEAVAREDEAAARLQAAREALNLAQAGFRDEEIAAAEAELALARAEAASAETQRMDTQLKAPSEGTIISRIREPGAILRAGEPVYTLSLDEQVWVRAYVDEPDLGRIEPGMTAWVKSDSSPERVRGQVGFISPRAEFTPKNVETESLRSDLVYRVRIIVTESAAGLRQGMPVTVTFGETRETGGEVR